MSERFDLLIVGGGPAGFAAARGYRDAGGGGEVGIVADEQRMPYRRPPLTKELLRGDAGEEDLPLEDERWLSDHSVRLLCGRATSLDASARTVVLAGGRELTYRSCVLAPGAEPKRLPIPGADDPGVRVVRSLDHVRELLRRLGGGPDGQPRSSADDVPVVVIGSGFIGCEIAASLRFRGHPVAMVSDEQAPNEARLGPEAANELSRWLADDGVDLHLGEAVERIERHGASFEVVAGEGRLRAAVVVMAAGVAPRSELAVAAGVALEDGAIPVSGAMRSERPGLLAAGDVCLALNPTAGRRLRVEHWGEALAQGEVAGRSAAGDQAVWHAVPGFWSTIGRHTIKYVAWGDGFDATNFQRHADGGFTARYGRDGRLVGVLTYRADADYERGRELIAAGARW